jgi:very-short-patch-repair endonuclease
VRVLHRMPNNRDYTRRLLGFARVMRHEQTDAERKMWALLRSRRLQRFKFRRQHPIAGYIVDFICLAEKLVVELDGGQHLDLQQAEYDERRTARLMELGMRVLRFTDLDVLRENAVLEKIYNSLVAEEPSPHPSPGVPGEGVTEHPAEPSPANARVARASPSPGTPGEGRVRVLPIPTKSHR